MKFVGKLCISLLSVLMIVGVVPVSAKVKLNATSKSLYVGHSYTLKLTGTSKKGKAKSSSSSVKVYNVYKTKRVKVRKRVTVKVKVRGKWKKKRVWRKVSVKKKVTVKNNFKLTAKKVGTATVSVTYGKSKATCKVKVIKKPSMAQLNTVVGYTYNLASRLSHTSGSTYWTSNQAVALVDEKNGLLMPVHSGSCTISRKVNGKVKNQIKINVTSSANVKVGIDVSKHNGSVNYNTLKKNHINFAIIRGGNGCHKYKTTDAQSIDLNLETNIQGAKKAGMDFGLYWYLNSSTSGLMTSSDAKKQGENFAKRLVTLNVNKNTPIYIDLEERTALVAKGSATTKANFQKEMCQAFEKKLREKGFTNIGIYASTSWYKDYLANDYFMNKVEVGQEGVSSYWLANYNFASKTSAQTPQFTYKGRVITPDIWQTGSQYRVSGVQSDYADMNYYYVK